MSGNLYDRFEPDNSALSYADLHHEITRSVEDIPLKYCMNHQNQGNCRRASEEDELVKYMSDLPGYLERGENIHDKVLNVGVLDWACLEQWQYRHKHMPHRSSGSSTSTSNTSSFVSTDRLSGHSSRGRSSSPSRQRICHPSRQSHFTTSQTQGHSQVAKSFAGSFGNYQNRRGSHGNTNSHSQFVRAHEHLSQNIPDSRLEACNRKDLDLKIDVKRVILPNYQMYEATSCTKLEMSTQNGELEKRKETLQQPNMDPVKRDVLRKNKPLVFLLPRDIPQDIRSGVSDMRTYLGQMSENPSQMSFSEKSKELPHRDVNYEISNSCPLQYEVNCNHSQAKGSSSIDAESIKIPAATFSAALSAKMGISPSKSRKAERRQTVSVISYAKEPSQGLTQKVTSEKSRSSSPFRRFSFSTGFVSKGSGCKEDVLLPHRSSVAAVKSNSGNTRGSSSSDISGNGKAGDAGRSKSPLRRLLDPLLKPKAANCRHSMESCQKDSALINKNCMSANGKFFTLQTEKELDRDHRVGCSTINTDDSIKNKKHASPTVQALLRIAVKNGLPLFTFAVDKNSNILAATVKLSSSGKDDCSCIYTFFSFKEVKKKNGNWMKQAGKSKGPNYIHHVVAQMKVSNSHFFDLTGQNCVDSPTVKEFVLYSVKLRQGDDQDPDYQPDDELAAIILRIPKTISFIKNVQRTSFYDDNQDVVHATVVLPSGVHSHPSKGGPSSLIERWKSGGSCDCGGWDVGCKLKILANENQAGIKSNSSKAYLEDQFELFLQTNEHEHRPAFRFVPFKHGIFSVVFDSSLSLLQAFSMCIALVDGKMPSELSGSRNLVEGKTSSVQTDGI